MLTALNEKMGLVAAPPFESFYAQHRDGVYAFLLRRVGRDRVDDAFQETFLRALRGYAGLAHAENLRAWVFTIAARVAVDEHRRARPRPLSEERAFDQRRPPYAEVEHLADGLPPKERAAVVLRYAYDLEYVDIAAALGSTEEAARQAASSGVRRLRKQGVTL